MANMARKEGPGDYQIGIWSVRREGKQWLAQAVGPGTIGDGSPHYYPTLAAAHLALTGEPRTETCGPNCPCKVTS